MRPWCHGIPSRLLPGLCWFIFLGPKINVLYEFEYEGVGMDKVNCFEE